MKFNVDHKQFMKTICPVVNVAGKTIKKNAGGNFHVLTPRAIDELLGYISRGIDTSLNEHTRTEEYKKVYKMKNSIKKEVCSHVTENINRLGRVTINARKDLLTVSGSNGTVTISITLSDEKLALLGYQCEIEGDLTVESGPFWKMLQSLSQQKQIILTSDCDSHFTMQSQENNTSRELEKLHNHINPLSLYRCKVLAQMKPEVLTKGIKDTQFTIEGDILEVYRQLVMQFSEDKVRFITGNGGIFAINDIECEYDLYEKKAGIVLGRDTLDSIMSVLSKMRGNNVQLCYFTRSRKTKWDLFLRQGDMVFSIPVKTYKNQFSNSDAFINYQYKYKACTKAKEWQLLFNTKRSRNGIVNTLLTHVEIDFIEGYFRVIQKSKSGSKSETYIPFTYDLEVPYVDPHSIKTEEVTFLNLSRHLVRLFKQAKPDDILSFEFGVKKQHRKKKIRDLIKQLVVIRFPVEVNKKRCTKETLTVFFPANMESFLERGEADAKSRTNS